MASKCDCKLWKANIDKVNGPITLQAARSGFRHQYDGEQFRFCPWCAKRLLCEECEVVAPYHRSICRWYPKEAEAQP